jgi:hypothetical protein
VTARLEKCVWTEDDFEQMGWHDATVHGIAFDWDPIEDDGGATVLLDVDYIVRWNAPTEEGGPYTFDVAPATLAFEDAWSIGGSLDGAHLERWEVLDLHRAPAQGSLWEWRIEGSMCELVFQASRLRQHFRSQPIANGGRQHLTSAARGGPSFARPTSF